MTPEIVQAYALGLLTPPMLYLLVHVIRNIDKNLDGY